MEEENDIDFNKTPKRGRGRPTKYNDRIQLTINPNVLRHFRVLCFETRKDCSAYVQFLMDEELTRRRGNEWLKKKKEIPL